MVDLMKMLLPLVIFLSLSFCRLSVASICEAPDNETFVQGDSHCLAIETTEAEEDAETLMVMLHGDTSRGGPVDYAFQAAKLFAGTTVTSVGMARPGYTAYNRKSSGIATRDQSRNVRYGLKEIQSIGTAISRLKTHHQAEQLILIGHSGGALIAGVLLGSHPNLIDGVILISCPCDVPRWRREHQARSLASAQSPHKWLKKARLDTRIIAITGSKDRNTFPRLAKSYIKAAGKRGMQAEYVEVAGAGHGLGHSLRSATMEAFHSMVADLLVSD